MKHTGKYFVYGGLAMAFLIFFAMASASASFRLEAQTKARPQENRGLDGRPLDPLGELERRADRESRDKRFRELQASASELADLSRKVSDDIEKGGQNVISAKVFENLDKIEKLVKQVRNKAKDGF